MARWYDLYPGFAESLEALKNLESSKRERIAKRVLRIVYGKDRDVIDDYVLSFSSSVGKKRWYDSNPFLWLIVNGLKGANPEVLSNTARLLKDKMIHAKKLSNA